LLWSIHSEQTIDNVSEQAAEMPDTAQYLAFLVHLCLIPGISSSLNRIPNAPDIEEPFYNSS
jgi:hypothetical protein